MLNQLPNGYRQKYGIASTGAAFFVFISSLIIAPFYINGDQVYYQAAYDGLADLDLIDGYTFYYGQLMSLEFGHFFVTWLASGIGIDKNLVMATANSLLAFYLMKLFEQWKVSLFVAIAICITNYYMLGMYFSAERLKFGFLFFIISVYYVSRKKTSIIFSLLAITSHLQTILLYVAFFLPGTVKSIFRHVFRLVTTFKFKYIEIIIPLFLFCTAVVLVVVFLGEQISHKIGTYVSFESEKNDPLSMLRVILFFVITLAYTNKRLDVFLQFIPLFAAVALIGGDRVNAIAYVIFMSYALKYKRGLNFGVLLTGLYFAYKSYDFLVRIIETGHGFA